MKKVFVFLVRLINIPGAIAVFIAYASVMCWRGKHKREVVVYEIVLRNTLIGALPWVSFAIWAVLGLRLAFTIQKLV